jgi:hypothetical protein
MPIKSKAVTLTGSLPATKPVYEEVAIVRFSPGLIGKGLMGYEDMVALSRHYNDMLQGKIFRTPGYVHRVVNVYCSGMEIRMRCSVEDDTSMTKTISLAAIRQHVNT